MSRGRVTDLPGDERGGSIDGWHEPAGRAVVTTRRTVAPMPSPVDIVDFTELDAARAGLVRAELAAAGTPIGPYDALIAAQAAREAHVLVTGNTREFGRVTDLETDNWFV